ncbi:hypothetical protein B0A48_00003 [Cryoendolithus antarcticus]|uniref:Uncharacterized protein n=1 Tax=Cryoendolithus antarcticus TaxID=1507870 RepID=A0A1V8TTV9_9PEZI|nr:hypothetical protein B0A48_00003 [Cryoendolithus antarcticus]
MDAMADPQNDANATAIELEKIARDHDLWVMEVQFWIAAAGAILLISIVWCVLVRIAQLRRPQVDLRAALEDYLLQGRPQDTAHLTLGEKIVIGIQCSLRELVWSLLFERKGNVDSGLPLPNTHDHRWSASRRIRKYVRKLRTAVSAPLKVAHMMIKKAVKYTKLVLSAIARATATSLVAIAGPVARYALNVRADERGFHWRARINYDMERLRQQLEAATKRARLQYLLNEKPAVREVRIVLYEHIIHADLSTPAGLHVKDHHFLAPTLALTRKALANEVRPVQLRLIEKVSDYRITWLIPDISPPSLLRLFGTLQQHHEDLLQDFYLTQSLWSDGQCRSLVRIRDMGVEICLSRKAISLLRGLWTPKGRVPGSLRHCDRVKWASELQEPGIEVECGVWYLVRYLGWKRAMWRECRRLMGVWGITAAGTWARGQMRAVGMRLSS